MKNHIVVGRGEVKALAELFGCTRTMVSGAIHFRRDSALARKIRKVAVMRGGVDLRQLKIKN